MAARGVRSVSGSPCSTVWTKLACGSGRRWELEIETTGTSAWRANTGCSSGRSSRPCSVVTNGVFWRLNSENGQ